MFAIDFARETTSVRHQHAALLAYVPMASSKTPGAREHCSISMESSHQGDVALQTCYDNAPHPKHRWAASGIGCGASS